MKSLENLYLNLKQEVARYVVLSIPPLITRDPVNSHQDPFQFFFISSVDQENKKKLHGKIPCSYYIQKFQSAVEQEMVNGQN